MKTKGFEPSGLIERDAKVFAKYLNEPYGCMALPHKAIEVVETPTKNDKPLLV